MARKILVPIDISNPGKSINDFLYPKLTENGLVLTGIKTDKKWDYGMVVLTSEKTENDIFRKIVDSGVKISSVENTFKYLKEYINVIPNFKIGNIVEINSLANKVELILKYQKFD